jgi:hypothetical protein
VTNAVVNSSSVNMSVLNGEIPVAMNPEVMFDDVTEWRKACFIICGRSKMEFSLDDF